MRKAYKTTFLLLISLLLVILNINSVLADSPKAGDIPQIKSSAKNFDEFIPKGWILNYKVEGDLNKDKLTDIAAVIEQDIGDWLGKSDAPKRILIICFKQKDNSYKVSLQSSKAILRADEGGVYGDPFLEGLSCDRGSLVIDFYGGSIDRWAMTYRFRFQNNGWYMIGATILNLNLGTGKETINDYNLLTGKLIVTTGQEGGKNTSRTTNRGKRKLLSLTDFFPWVVAGEDF